MKNKLMYAGVVAAFLAAAIPALAATTGIALRHAGIGQKAGDTANFGVAICNNGTQTISGSTPFTVTANGHTANVVVVGPLAGGSCKYTYLAYSSFGMAAGATYSVNVSIDPSHTVTSNVDAPAVYSLKVPGQVLGASAVSDAERQSMLDQLASMAAILHNLLVKLGLE